MVEKALIINFITLHKDGSQVSAFDRITNSTDSLHDLIDSYLDDEAAEVLTLRVIKGDS